MPAGTRLPFLVLVLAVALLGCGPGATATPSEGDGLQQPPGRGPTRTLVMVARGQPESIAGRAPRQTGGGTRDTTLRVWNAGLAISNEREIPQPYLAEALPQLNTDSWRVFPDGRMETTYRLKANLAWHDGARLSANDFVFAWRVYSTPELGEATAVPLKYLDEVLAPDDGTVVFRWKQAYADAGALQAVRDGFQALPRHILAQPFETAAAAPDAFSAHSFWAQEYVGLGPFRLERWEPATFLEGSAFGGHALGRPRIDRVKVLFIPDANTVLANLLSGEAHVNIDDSIRFQQAAILQREWSPRNAGIVLLSPAQIRYTHLQLKPELANPRALLDLRFRQGLAHALDKQALVDALLDGQGIIADTFMVPQVESFPDIDRAINKYPYDLRRTEQLFHEMGIAKGADGFYASPVEGRVVIDVRVLSSAANETEAAVMADSFRRGGIDSTVYVFPQAQGQDAVARASFPSLTSSSIINAFEPPLDRLRASDIPSPETRWRGSNRGSWNNPEFERLAAAYEGRLDRAERNQAVVQMMAVISKELPAYPLIYNFMVTAHVAELHGPVMSVSARATAWNVHQWEWR